MHATHYTTSTLKNRGQSPCTLSKSILRHRFDPFLKDSSPQAYAPTSAALTQAGCASFEQTITPFNTRIGLLSPQTLRATAQKPSKTKKIIPRDLHPLTWNAKPWGFAKGWRGFNPGQAYKIAHPRKYMAEQRDSTPVRLTKLLIQENIWPSKEIQPQSGLQNCPSKKIYGRAKRFSPGQDENTSEKRKYIIDRKELNTN